MKRIWPFAMSIGLLVACHQQQNVRREVWPSANQPKPPAAAAEAPTPPPKVLDPIVVVLPEKSPVMQVRKQLDKGNPGKAREVAEAALPAASARDKGRLHWLAAKAALDEGYSSIALAHLDTLSNFNHPLARWAKLRRASLLERTDPVTAAQIAASLTDDWAGSERARTIEVRSGGAPTCRTPISRYVSTAHCPRSHRKRLPPSRTSVRACSKASTRPRPSTTRSATRGRAALRKARQTSQDRKRCVVRRTLQARPRASADRERTRGARSCARSRTSAAGPTEKPGPGHVTTAARAYGRIGDWNDRFSSTPSSKPRTRRTA